MAKEYEGLVCVYCKVKVGGTTHVRCASCPERSGRYCVDCFSVCAVLEPHSVDHGYRIVGGEIEPVTAEDWTAAEDVRLLDGLLKYGFGSWRSVAEYVETKSRKECAEHYERAYMNSENFPFPSGESLPASVREVSDDDAESSSSDETAKGQLQVTRNKSGGAGPHHELSGFYPLREDFDTEWDDEAERAISELNIEQDDTAEEKGLKMRLLQIYQERLRERESVKSFVFDRNLLDFEGLRSRERRQCRDEKGVSTSLKIFSRLQPQDWHEQFEQAVLYEQRLVSRILDLSHYRAQGLQSFSEVDMYELDRRRRVSDIQLRAVKEPAYKVNLKVSKRGSRYVNRDRPGTSEPGRRSEVEGSPQPERAKRAKLGTDDSHGVHVLGCKDIEPALNVSSMPGYDALFPKEREMCSALRLAPTDFLAAKRRTFEAMAGFSGDAVGTQPGVRWIVDLSKRSEGESFTLEMVPPGDGCGD